MSYIYIGISIAGLYCVITAYTICKLLCICQGSQQCKRAKFRSPVHISETTQQIMITLKSKLLPENYPSCETWSRSDDVGDLGEYPVSHSIYSFFVISFFYDRSSHAWRIVWGSLIDMLHQNLKSPKPRFFGKRCAHPYLYGVYMVNRVCQHYVRILLRLSYTETFFKNMQ